MRLDQGKGLERFSRFCARFILGFVLLFMAVLLPMSLLYTTGMSTGDGKGEVVSFLKDNFFVNSLSVLLLILLVYLLWRLLEVRSLRFVSVLLCAYVLVIGFGLVMSAKLQPSEDSYVLSFFARQAAKGDLSYYNAYFRYYPYQFGYVLYAELFFRLFYLLLPHAPDGFSSMALQGMNVIYTAFSYVALLHFSRYLFKNEELVRLIALLFFLCIPALYFVTYMYGNVPSFACICGALWAFAAFQVKGNWIGGPLCVLALCLAVLLKLNSMIAVTAFFITALVLMLRTRRLKMLLFLLGLSLALGVTAPLPQRLYETRAEKSYGEGIPMISWLAMGLHEGESCAGWYSPQYTTSAFANTDFDPAATAELAEEAIRIRLQEFSADRRKMVDFFRRKFLSQWNEPSYQGLWNNQVRSHYSPPGFFYQLLCHRSDEHILGIMNTYQQMIFFAFTVGLLLLLRRGDTMSSLLPLIILGGMLYHLLFEAKSQHAQGYFILMIPIAAYGLQWIFHLSKKRITP